MKSLKRTDFSKDERNQWRNIEVNIDSFSDRWEDLYKEDFEKRLALLPKPFLKNILEHFKIAVPNDANEYTKTLTSDRRHSILTYCVISFALKNPKAIAEVFGFKIIKNEIDKNQVIQEIFKQYQKQRLVDLFLYLLRLKYGKSKNPSNFSQELKEEDYDKLVDLMPKLATYLKRKDQNKKKYHFRFSYKSSKHVWIFLLLKETNDKVYHAIPHNISMVSGTYKLITIDTSSRSMDIHAGSKGEALLMRNYINNKLNNYHTFVKNEKKYQPKKFFEKVFNTAAKTNLSLIDAKFKKSNLGVKIHLNDAEKKNDIVASLKFFQKAKALKLEDFSEFEELTFYFNGLSIRLQIAESTWGTHLLNLVDKSIPESDLTSFKKQFQSKYKVPLNTWLKRFDSQANKNFIISRILDIKTVPINTVTDEVEEIILELVDNKILSQFQKQVKRECQNPSCRAKTWQKGSCPKCGNDMNIIGDYLDIKSNPKGIYDYIFKSLKKNSGLKITKDTVQIFHKKHPFIDLMNQSGDNLSIYVSNDEVPTEIVDHFKNNALPLLVVLTRFKDALAHELKENNFECIGLVDLYSNSKNPTYFKYFNQSIENQKLKWRQKLVDKGFKSYQSATKKKGPYNYVNFETDIFNMLHEMFYVAFKLGGNFTGIAAPDGIVSIQNNNKPLKKFCMSWDCKFSGLAKGYQISEPAPKHRHYIKVLMKNKKVKFYGSLKVHAIISNNMDSGKYQDFYSALTNKFRWKGKIILINDTIIRKLYYFYRLNSAKILSNPTIFYTAIHKLFSKIYVKDLLPYPVLSDDRLNVFIDNVKDRYAKKSVILTFERKDFDK